MKTLRPCWVTNANVSAKIRIFSHMPYVWKDIGGPYTISENSNSLNGDLFIWNYVVKNIFARTTSKKPRHDCISCRVGAIKKCRRANIWNLSECSTSVISCNVIKYVIYSMCVKISPFKCNEGRCDVLKRKTFKKFSLQNI